MLKTEKQINVKGDNNTINIVCEQNHSTTFVVVACAVTAVVVLTVAHFFPNKVADIFCLFLSVLVGR